MKLRATRNGFISSTHPADYGTDLKETLACIREVEKRFPIDAVEVSHQGFYTPAFDTQVIPYPKLVTDDAHTPLGCGRAWIQVECERKKDIILGRIKQGRFQNHFVGNFSLRSGPPI